MRLFLVWLTVFAAPVYAADLEVTYTAIRFDGSNEVQAYVLDTKTYEERTRYSYTAYIAIKNTGATEVRLITGALSPDVWQHEDRPKEIVLKHDKKKIQDSLLVPSESDLRIVGLRPNETAGVEFDFRSSKELSRAKVIYAIEDHYGDRFQYWTGRLVGQAVDVKN